jgi:putative proteasome-type protease
MLADTRTSASVDNISTYRKLRVFGNDGRRLIAIASAGSLSTTQAAMERLQKGFAAPDTHETESLDTAPSIQRATFLAGQALRFCREALEGLKQDAVNFDATLLVGGSIGGEPTRLFQVYAAGNAIECAPDTPYLQIGEAKYGRPILDRVLTYDTALPEALKLGLISFSSTMRSDVAVGLPIDLMTARAAQSQAETLCRIDEHDAYFSALNDRWSAALRQAQVTIPAPPYR